MALSLTSDKETLLKPLMQAGFAGMCMILIAVIVWQQSKVFTVIENNTKAFYELKEEINASSRIR